jgi:hypothetical protein
MLRSVTELISAVFFMGIRIPNGLILNGFGASFGLHTVQFHSGPLATHLASSPTSFTVAIGAAQREKIRTHHTLG